MNFEVENATQYLSRLQDLVPRARSRIVLAAMMILGGDETSPVLEQILKAAERGVKVHVLADRYVLSMASKPSDVSKTTRTHQQNEVIGFFKALEKSGGKAIWIGEIGLNPYAGRYHCKITVVDDDVFSFGGVNFTDDSFDNVDFMLHATNSKLADDLVKLVTKNAQGHPAEDFEQELDQDNIMLFDAGQRGKSIIYDRACRLAAQSDQVTYVSQMAPSGRLAAALRKASATCFCTRPGQADMGVSRAAQTWDWLRNGLANSYEGQNYIHAKFILYKLKDGGMAALCGSHNFSWRGVAFGTKEIALLSYDPKVYKQLQAIVYKVATAS